MALSNSEYKARLNALADALSARLDDLLASLNICYKDKSGVLTGCCPIHKGNNPTSWQMYRNSEGGYPPGVWRCYSKHCHQNFPATLIGFVQGVLGGNFQKALNYCLNFVGVSQLEDFQVDMEIFEKKEWVRQADSFCPPKGNS